MSASDPSDPPPPREPFFDPRAFEARPVVGLTLAMLAIHALIVWGGLREGTPVRCEGSWAYAVDCNFAFISSRFWSLERLWTAVTYAMLHGSWMHIGFNAVAFFALGTSAWRLMGTLRFLAFFAATAAASAFLFAALRPAETVVLVGASGTVFGLIAAVKRADYRVLKLQGRNTLPDALKLFAFIVIANVVIGLAPVDASVGFAGEAVAWEAHIGGFVAGWLIASWCIPRWR